MKKPYLSGAAIAAAAAFTSPASAAVLCTSGPVINLVTTPCIFPAPPQNEAAVELAIWEATGSNIDISLYGKSDDNAALFDFTPDNPHGEFTVNWSVIDNSLIKYLVIKGGNEFKLVELAGAGASSGVASAFGLVTNDISHISFWTTATPSVPEPGTWAMLILGFGLVGGALRGARKNRPALNYI